MLKAMIELIARLSRPSDLNKHIVSHTKNITNADILLRHVSCGEILSKATNLEKILTAGQLGVPCIVVGGAVLMQRLFRAAVVDVMMLVADEAKEGYFPFPLTGSLVDGGANAAAVEGADFACSQAEKGICGRERGGTYSGAFRDGKHFADVSIGCLVIGLLLW
jgi:hypothetical protein